MLDREDRWFEINRGGSLQHHISLTYNADLTSTTLTTASKAAFNDCESDLTEVKHQGLPTSHLELKKPLG